VRQQVWKLIEKLKEGKSIILTTHSMEEADVLADRICVIVKGQLKCIGTTFYLKRTYGEGHRMLINLKNREDEHKVVDKIQKLFPNIHMVDCRGGSLILGISEYNDLLYLVKKLESKESMGLDEYEIKNCIKAWSVSHSTLEEVFMKVSKEKEE
jgi:ABC-type multidrug transport system ATPase subunit